MQITEILIIILDINFLSLTPIMIPLTFVNKGYRNLQIIINFLNINCYNSLS